jgi:hypothetical protein
MEPPVENTGEIAMDAAGPEVVSQEQTQAEAVQEKAPEMVPVTALQAERRERQQLQEQKKILEDHVALLRSNQGSNPQEKNEAQGLADDDVLTYGDVKGLLGDIRQRTEEQRMRDKYQDYEETVTKYLPKVIEENPALRSTLLNDENRYYLAYKLAKTSDAYREDNKVVKRSADAQRIVENSQKAGSLSSVGSTAPQSQVSSYKNMSDADFMKMANRNMGRF